MKQLNVYLTFSGTCQQALDFYAGVFNGRIVHIQKFAQIPADVLEQMPPLSDEDGQRVMHAQFEAEGLSFMASDSLPGSQIAPGGPVTLSLNVDDQDEQTRLFEQLSEGGQVHMPLDIAFWGARFGMLQDRFGVSWMLNCELAPKAHNN